MKQDDKLDPRLAALLDKIKPASARNPQAAARARSRFVAQAVSASEERRHNWWITIFQQKEKFAMNMIMSALVVLGLLFGGSATVSAAQDDLPNQPLYQLKLVSEDARVWLASDPGLKIEMLMEQVQTRTEEMAALTLAGITPPAELTIRTQERIQQALHIASNLDDASMVVAMKQIRTHLQTQEQLLIQLQDGTCTECEPILRQTREMLHTQLGQVEDSIADPGTFRDQNQNQNQNRNQVQTTQTPLATDSTITPQTSCTPALDGTGQQNGNNIPPAGTPMPQDNGNNQNNNDNGSGDGNSNDNGNGNESGNGSGPAPDPGGQGGKP